jgi:hypothetical protein
MTTCNDVAVAKIGNNNLCLEHLANSLPCVKDIEMYDIHKKGFKTGKEILYKKDFLERAKGIHEKQ